MPHCVEKSSTITDFTKDQHTLHIKTHNNIMWPVKVLIDPKYTGFLNQSNPSETEGDKRRKGGKAWTRALTPKLHTTRRRRAAKRTVASYGQLFITNVN
jgi:hypothetical protein